MDAAFQGWWAGRAVSVRCRPYSAPYSGPYSEKKGPAGCPARPFRLKTGERLHGDSEVDGVDVGLQGLEALVGEAALAAGVQAGLGRRSWRHAVAGPAGDLELAAQPRRCLVEHRLD